MKYLIAGLGNTGAEYAHTRHNIGFDILDTLAVNKGISFVSDRLADYALFKLRGRVFHLIKPSTYMNLSGKAIRYWTSELKIPLEHTLVITDDIALPFGKLRLKNKGSDGGHNGLKNIIEIMGTQNFPRLRFGIGDEFHKGNQVNFVLSKWSEEEEGALKTPIVMAINIIESFGINGIERTMNQFN